MLTWANTLLGFSWSLVLVPFCFIHRHVPVLNLDLFTWIAACSFEQILKWLNLEWYPSGIVWKIEIGQIPWTGDLTLFDPLRVVFLTVFPEPSILVKHRIWVYGSVLSRFSFYWWQRLVLRLGNACTNDQSFAVIANTSWGAKGDLSHMNVQTVDLIFTCTRALIVKVCPKFSLIKNQNRKSGNSTLR